jgi:hypothetical protein
VGADTSWADSALGSHPGRFSDPVTTRSTSALLFTMSKRSLSPVHLPPAKRPHLSASSPSTSLHASQSTNFETLYDELILYIFTFLSYVDLCALQATDRNCARLSLDNQVHSTFISGTPFSRGRIEHSGYLLLVVEEPLPTRVWEAPLEGFQGFRRP